MLNDRELARVAHALYDYDGKTPDDYFNHLLPHDGGYVGVKNAPDGGTVECWRGSTTLMDWIEDLRALPEYDPGLGAVHSGFLRGVDSVVAELDKVSPCPTYVIGHSLGGGHAAIRAAGLILRARVPAKITLWGCPRPGFQRLADILARKRVTSYRNRDDVVTKVPLNIAPNLLYVDAAPFVQVDVAPVSDLWGVLRDHHFALYETAMSALFPPTTDTPL
jgi:hypothetical protein